MRRFEFRLETALRWRRSQLEAEESRLQALIGERDLIRQRIQQADQARRLAELGVLEAALIPAEELAALEVYRRWLRRERERLKQAEQACEGRLAAQRQRVIAAQRKVRLLEKLRQRRLAEWEGELARELETLASEAYLAQWGRR